MNIIFNDICKIEKINKTVGYAIKDSFEYQVIPSYFGFCVKISYNIDDNGGSYSIYMSNDNKNEIINSLELIKVKKMIKEFHDELYNWINYSILKMEKNKKELSNIYNSFSGAYASVSLNNHDGYLMFINGKADTLDKKVIFEDEIFCLFLSGDNIEKHKNISFELLEKNTNIVKSIHLPYSESTALMKKVFNGFEKKESLCIEFYKVNKLNDVKKYLPQIVSSAIKNDIPDGYIFDCERQYFEYSVVDFKNNNDLISMRFNL